MNYVIQYRGLENRPLYYSGHGWFQDSPEAGGTKVFRTVFLADAHLFGDIHEAQKIIDELSWASSGCKIELITDEQYEKAKQFKFKEQLAGNYISTKSKR